MIPRWSPVTFHFLRERFTRKFDNFDSMPPEKKEHRAIAHDIIAREFNLISNLYDIQTRARWIDFGKPFRFCRLLLNALCDQELAQMDPTQFARRREQEKDITINIGSEAAVFITAGMPYVRKFYPKRGHTLCIEKIVSLPKIENECPVLAIHLGTLPNNNMVSERNQFYSDWPGFMSGRITEYEDCYRINERRLETPDEKDPLPLVKWFSNNEASCLYSVSVPEIDEAALASMLIHPISRQVAVVTDVRYSNGGLDPKFENKLRLFDAIPEVLTPDMLDDEPGLRMNVRIHQINLEDDALDSHIERPLQLMLDARKEDDVQWCRRVGLNPFGLSSPAGPGNRGSNSGRDRG